MVNTPSATATERASVVSVPMSSWNPRPPFVTAQRLHSQKYVQRCRLRSRFLPSWTGQKRGCVSITCPICRSRFTALNSHVRRCGQHSYPRFLWRGVACGRLFDKVTRAAAQTPTHPLRYRSPIQLWFAARLEVYSVGCWTPSRRDGNNYFWMAYRKPSRF